MKTVMQQLIDIIDKGISVLKESQIKERIILEGVKGEAEKLLEAEYKQIRGWFRTNGQMSEDGEYITYSCEEIEDVFTKILTKH